MSLSQYYQVFVCFLVTVGIFMSIRGDIDQFLFILTGKLFQLCFLKKLDQMHNLQTPNVK